MNHSLNPDFSYVANRRADRAYVVSKWGQRSVVNVVALELMCGDDRTWQGDPDYAEFFEQAKASGWLVPGEPPKLPRVRFIDEQHHLQRVQYEINLVCNLTCLHCYCASSPRAPAGQPTDFVLDLVRQAAALGVIFFDVTGGEPLIRRDVVDVIGAIAAAGMVPGMLTNATLATPPLARRLVRAGLASVQVSLDSCTAEVHDEVRGQTGAFDRAMRGIRAFRDAGIEPRISVTLNQRNKHQARDIVRFFQEELGLAFNFDRVIPAGRSLEQRANPLELSNAEYYEIIRSCEGASTTKVCDSPSVMEGNGHVEPACGVGASYLFIKQDGRAALCPTMTEAESSAFEQADLKQMSLADAWLEHPTFRRFRDMQCENVSHCPSGKSCRGGCRSNAYLLHGTVTSPDEMSCNFSKNDGPSYRPFLTEYERLRREGTFPPRPGSFQALRRLPVIA